MADQMTKPNDPSGEPPVEASEALEAEILDVFELGDTNAAADKIASAPGAAEPPEGLPSSPAPSEAGEVGSAPASPVTPPQPGTEAPAQPAAAEPAPAQPSGAPAAPPSAAPETQPAAPQPVQPPTEAELRMASLQATVDALTRERDALLASSQPAPSGQPAPGAAPESGTAPGEPPPFKYSLTLPQQLQEALVSDDPQQAVAAITSIVNDLGTIVHNTVLAQVRGEVRGMLTQLASMADQSTESDTRQQALEASRQEYYKDFPGHNNPLVLPIIQAESQKMASEFPNLQWGPQYRAALGARVDAAIEQLRTGTAPAEVQPQPSPNPAPPARPAAMLPSGAPGAAAVTPSGDISDQILDVLDPFSAG